MSAVSTTAEICSAYKGIKAEFLRLLPPVGTSLANFNRSNILARAVRLPFHDATELDITQPDKLGIDGCLSKTAENAGLIPFGSVTSTMVQTLFEPIFQNYCDKISRADFWALLGWLAVSISSDGRVPVRYQYGRKDSLTCDVPSTRLPSAQQGRGGIQAVFVRQMGLTLADAVALIGAHTLGHVHPEFSGYGVATTPVKVFGNNDLITNAWDTTPHLFDNTYYSSMATFVRNIHYYRT